MVGKANLYRLGFKRCYKNMCVQTCSIEIIDLKSFRLRTRSHRDSSLERRELGDSFSQSHSGESFLHRFWSSLNKVDSLIKALHPFCISYHSASPTKWFGRDIR